MSGSRRPRTGIALALWLSVAALAACGGSADEKSGAEVAAEEPGTTRSPDAHVFPGTPPGGLDAWIDDIRAGLDGLPRRARQDPDSAEQAALDLYLSRQEYIERYYGAGGPRAGGQALAAAVDAAEASFHELMRVTGKTPPPDSASVAEAVARLRERLGAVAREARAAGVPLDPPTGDPGAEDERAPSTRPAERGGAVAASAGGEAPGLLDRLEALERGLAALERPASGDAAEVRRRAVRLYLDHYEPVEALYGPGGPYAVPELAARVAAGEEAFHVLMRGEEGEAASAADRLHHRLAEIRDAAREAEVPLEPDPAAVAAGPEPPLPGGGASEIGRPGEPRSPEVAAVVRELRSAETAWSAGDTAAALAGVERAYLDGFEPLEPRLPAALVRRIERHFHLRLRPLIARGAADDEVSSAFSTVYGELATADAALEAGTPFWFGAFNAFAIILREGLEAVLLIGAILAYLSRISGEDRHRRQVYAGVGLGVLASLATWALARLVVPVGGAGRELIEGVTALLAVGVLVYVSHWLFHKTYVHDWKRYLTDRVGGAVSTGSAFAMAALAFAAVYREGFETVLFYQALLFDAGAGALLAGFLPGLLLIVGLGVGIIRLGVRLPIRKTFAATNAILLYLAFVFLGKGLYNLQEAGVFAPHPVAWIPDHAALRQLLGLYPVAETVAAQAVLLILIGGGYVYYRGRGKERERAATRGYEPSSVAAGR